MFLEKEEV